MENNYILQNKKKIIKRMAIVHFLQIWHNIGQLGSHMYFCIQSAAIVYIMYPLENSIIYLWENEGEGKELIIYYYYCYFQSIGSLKRSRSRRGMVLQGSPHFKKLEYICIIHIHAHTHIMLITAL